MTADVQRMTPALLEEIDRINASGRRTVVFVHGLWLRPSSWDRWAVVFEEAGYAPLTPGWPDDPETDAAFASKSAGEVADHYAEVFALLTKKPAVIGHSFGGLVAQILAGRGLSAASVVIDAAPFHGVLPLPISAMRDADTVFGSSTDRAVPLSFEQFRYAFANVVAEPEAKELFATFAVLASGEGSAPPAANPNPWTGAPVDSTTSARGPMLIISGATDHTGSRNINDVVFDKQKSNPGVTGFVEVPKRGHSLTIDSGWREVADIALRFIKRFV